MMPASFNYISENAISLTTYALSGAMSGKSLPGFGIIKNKFACMYA